MAPLPTLVDELVEEVLLRLRPEDPAELVRAALVCRRWPRLVSGPAFRHRFRELHPAPPMLGFLGSLPDADGVTVSRFVPTPPFRAPRADRRNLRAFDVRHGRVLLHALPGDGTEDLLAVWDPVTDEQWDLPAPPQPPRPLRPYTPWSWNAAVLCAASQGGRCDHLGCRRGPFLVVHVGSSRSSTFIRVYSSEAGAWSSAAIADAHQLPCDRAIAHPHQLPCDRFELEPSTLVGDAVYFKCYHDSSARILEYNVATREVSVIQLTPEFYNDWERVVLMSSEDGRLGFAEVRMSRLYLWLKEIGTNGDVTWARSRVVELDAQIPIDALAAGTHVAAVAEGVRVVFVRTAVGFFTVDIKSGQIKKLEDDHGYYEIVPYMSFCTPEWNILHH